MPGPIQSIQRAAEVLKLLAHGGAHQLSVGEIARALDLAKPTVHGILRTLQEVGFVEQEVEGGKYRLGAALFQIGTSYLDGNELRAKALNWSDTLAMRAREAVRIGVMHGKHVLVVHHVFRPDNSRQTLDTGALLPWNATALGKALVAFGDNWPDGDLQAFTRHTLDPEQLHADMNVVRDRDWAYDLHELVEGEASVAAPIRDRRGVVVGAIGISGPVERLCDSPDQPPRLELVSYVREAARSVSRELGGLSW
ncbi:MULTISPECIES: IclR family transcriptional regulator [Lentzea]|uniref:Glycerol operon regulatory protein n=1 Tax=Lentzea albidocapillata TaxID=40571 RepID=A0A1W2DM28_9PSEU|nr:IclR family transcriptional regulator [Lentzea albidocapillata]SMC98604.1 transcriptional regulator, IclR family [Lentzea albidocapillata]